MSRLHSERAAPLAVRSQIDSSRRQAAAWWAGRTPRERRLLSTGALFLALTLVWVAGLKPALDSIAHSQRLLPRLHTEAAQIDALVLEAQALQHRQSGRIEPAAIPQALQTTLRRAGLEASATVASSGATEDSLAAQWEIRVTDASAARLMEWLASLPSLLHLRVKTAELSRSQVDGRDRPGEVSGRIVLQGLKERLP